MVSHCSGRDVSEPTQTPYSSAANTTLTAARAGRRRSSCRSIFPCRFPRRTPRRSVPRGPGAQQGGALGTPAALRAAYPAMLTPAGAKPAAMRDRPWASFADGSPAMLYQAPLAKDAAPRELARLQTGQVIRAQGRG